MSDYIVEIKNLRKTIGKKEILHGFSLNIKKGKIIGFLGPNGAGKTTTFKCITGLNSYTGIIRVCGADIKKHPQFSLNKIGVTIDAPCFYMNMTGRQNLNLTSSYYANITQESQLCLIEDFAMSEYIDRKVSKYSYGMKQRLSIAMALVHSPELLILDEPMNGLDPEGIHNLRLLLKKLCHEHGKTIIISSHILSEMQLLCDEVVFIKNGKVLGVEPMSDELEKRYISIMKLD